jgi:RNA polymerase sigma factor (sigma-70 family)
VIEIEGRSSGPDEREFDEFYRSRFDRAARLAYLLSGSSMHAPEIAQEALLAVHRRWRDLEEPDGYLRRTVVNLSRSAQRRAVLERRHAWRLQHRETESPMTVIDETWAQLGRLPHDQRIVIVLRFYEDRSIDEIADIVDKPVGTVKSLLHRGLRKLKETLHDRP